jgi:hypothetical protein
MCIFLKKLFSLEKVLGAFGKSRFFFHELRMWFLILLFPALQLFSQPKIRKVAACVYFVFEHNG